MLKRGFHSLFVYIHAFVLAAALTACGGGGGSSGGGSGDTIVDSPVEALRSDSISIQNNITIHNLKPLLTYLGMLGDPERDRTDRH